MQGMYTASENWLSVKLFFDILDTFGARSYLKRPRNAIWSLILTVLGHYRPLPRQRWGQMLVSWRFWKYQILAPMSGHYGSLCGSLLATSGPLEVPMRAYGTSMMSLLPPKASGSDLRLFRKVLFWSKKYHFLTPHFGVLATYFFICKSIRIELGLCMQVFMVCESAEKISRAKTNSGKLRYWAKTGSL